MNDTRTVILQGSTYWKNWRRGRGGGVESDTKSTGVAVGKESE